MRTRAPTVRSRRSKPGCSETRFRRTAPDCSGTAWTRRALDAIDTDAAAEVEAATEAAKAAPPPGRDELMADMWADGGPVAELTYRDAVARAIAQEMARDDTVVFIGEDVAAAGGVFKATPGCWRRSGRAASSTHRSPSRRSSDR